MATEFEKFARNFEAADSDISNLMRYLNSEFASPFVSWTSSGFKVTPAREKYGDDFVNASPEVRREFLERVDKVVLDKKYPELKDETAFSSFSGGAGTVAGSLFSPTTIVPVARIGRGLTNYLGVGVQGGLWAAEYNLFEQLANEGMVDTKELGFVAAIGAVGTPLAAKVIGDVITSPAAQGTGRALSMLFSPISKTAKAVLPPYRQKVTPEAIQKANSQFDEVTDAIIEAKAQGVGLNPAQEAANAEILSLQRQLVNLGKPLRKGDQVPIGSTFDRGSNRVLTRQEVEAAQNIRQQLRVKTINYRSNFAPIRADVSDDLLEAAAQKTDRTVDEVKEVLQLSSNKTFQGTQAEARGLIDAVEANKDLPSAAYKGRLGSNVLGIWSTELNKVAPALQKIIRKMDVDKAIKSSNIGRELNPFVKIQRAIDAKEGGNFELALFNADTKAISGYLKKHKNIKVKGVSQNPSSAYAAYRKTMDSIHSDLKEAGVDINYIKDYFPRKIKDFDGLIKELGLPKSRIDQMLTKRANDLGIRVEELNDFEKANILNRMVRGNVKDPSIASLSNKKQREIITLNERTKEYYENADVSLERYVRDALEEVELRKLFGRKGKDKWDIDGSIGNFLAKGREKKLFNPDDEYRIESLIKARYGEGRTSPSGLSRLITNAGYAGTLANPLSAITQIGDVATSAGLNGIIRTVLNTAPWARRVKYEDLGLDGLLTEMSATRGGKWLDNLFKTSGFAQVDKWGKNTFLNAALDKLIAQSKTTQGVTKLQRKYGVMFGDDFKGLVGDLRSLKRGDVVNDRIKSALLSELADAQPILKSEMPTAWLRNPELRIAWQLKSFTLKQLDIMRREIFQKLQSSDPAIKAEGARMLLVYPPLLGAGGATTTAIKDIMIGREDALDPDKFDDKFAENIIKMFGANKYMLDQAAAGREGAGDLLIDVVTPPATGFLNAATKTIQTEDLYYLANNIPLVGRLWANWYGGGQIRYGERLRDEGTTRETGLSFDILRNN